MAAKTNWSDIVPNFDSMPDAMQQWLATNLPTFISQAIHDGLQQGFDQHWGVAATGNSYHLVGTDHTHAVMGDHNEVVGGQTTRTRQDSVMTHNLADEIKVTEGAHSHQVNSHAFYLTLGTENRTIASHHATEVGGDHTLVVSGNSAAMAATHTVITGSGNTDDSVVTHSHTVTGSRYEAVSGTHYIQSGVVIRSVGGPLSTNFTPPTLPSTTTTSNPNGPSDGAIAHPNLAQELAPAAPPAAPQALSQQATTQTSSVQQQQQASDSDQSSSQNLAMQGLASLIPHFEIPPLTTKPTKTALNVSNMVWQGVTGGAAGIVTAGLALSSSPKPMDTVESTNYQGSIQDNIEGDRTTVVLGKMSDSFLAGADTFTKGSASDTVLGMAGDTVIGLSSDALIGLAMPFTLISMGQVLLNMDEDVCVVESKSFKLDIAGMKITTPGGATWGGKAATEATDLEKAEKLLADAKKAEKAAKNAKTALEDAEKTVKAADDAKLAKDAADLKAADKAEELAEKAKATKALQKIAEEKRAAKFVSIAKNEKKIEEGTATAEEIKNFNEAIDASEQAEQDVRDSEELLKTMQGEKDALDLVADSKNVKILDRTAHAGEDLSFLGKDTTLGKFFNVSKDSTAWGAAWKTVVKGGDWAKVFGGTDAAIASVKLVKATVKSVSKGLSVMNRNQIAKNQSKAVENDPKTKLVDGKEK